MASRFRVPTLRAFLALLGAALLSLGLATPASAGVTISFWSHEFGNEFPHAFFVLGGTPDAGGEPVQLSYGFTAKAITPAILMGTVPGRIDETKQKYIENSNVHFSVMLNFAMRLVDELGAMITASVGRVSLSFFATAHRAGHDLARIFVIGTHAISLAVLPLFFGLAAVAGDAVPLVFGARWQAAVPAVQPRR